MGTGQNFIRGNGLKSLEAMIAPKALEGTGVDLLARFLGCGYMFCAAINLLAAARFSKVDAASVLILSGLLFHILFGLVRMNLPTNLASQYKEGQLAKANKSQFILGAVCCAVGLFSAVPRVI